MMCHLKMFTALTFFLINKSTIQLVHGEGECNLTVADCPSNKYYIEPVPCECRCGILCSAIFSTGDCECCPIKGLECDEQYRGDFCNEEGIITLPPGCQGGENNVGGEVVFGDNGNSGGGFGLGVITPLENENNVLEGGGEDVVAVVETEIGNDNEGLVEVEKNCNRTESDCLNSNYIVDLNSCECVCEVQVCASMYKVGDCACCPIDKRECDPQYNQEFCDEDGNVNLPVGCQTSSAVAEEEEVTEVVMENEGDCDLMCAAIFTMGDCVCCPIKGKECHDQYRQVFCDEDGNINLPEGCHHSEDETEARPSIDNNKSEDQMLYTDEDDSSEGKKGEVALESNMEATVKEAASSAAQWWLLFGKFYLLVLSGCSWILL